MKLLTKCVSALNVFANVVLRQWFSHPILARIFIRYSYTFSRFSFLVFIRLLPDRQSKQIAESQPPIENVMVSTKRAKVSSICIPPNDTSIASNPSSLISSTDEGGFNEPSPEIKAKLKPAYSFDSQPATASADKKEDFNEDNFNANQHSLHYVDFGYRLNPDGSESKQCFSEETEEYASAKKLSATILEQEVPHSTHNVVTVTHKKTTVHYPVADSVVYAAIKSEPTSLSPPVESKYNCDNRNYRIEDLAMTDDNGSDLDEKFEQIYSSTKNDEDVDIELNGVIADADSQESFDMDNVEFADASEKDELPEAMTTYEEDRLLSSR